MNDLNIDFQKVELGQVILPQAMEDDLRRDFQDRLRKSGFDLLEPGKSALISKMKTLIVEQVHYSHEPLNVNFSTFLSEQLHYEYSYLSRLFSSVEGTTIEKFITRQKIEKVKELLFYDELNLTEIAFQMDYSSVAYLSTQFKRDTGMTPTEFKKGRKPGHHSLDF